MSGRDPTREGWGNDRGPDGAPRPTPEHHADPDAPAGPMADALAAGEVDDLVVVESMPVVRRRRSRVVRLARRLARRSSSAPPRARARRPSPPERRPERPPAPPDGPSGPPRLKGDRLPSVPSDRHGRIPAPLRDAARAWDRARPRTKRAVTVLLLLEVVALPLLVFLGRDQWFAWPDFDFLARRDASSLDHLVRPHGEQLSTIPVLAYRVLWAVFGLDNYVAYQVIVVALHLVAALLLWLVIRRTGAHPWLVTAAVALFVLLGSGDANIVWASQMAFTGALVFGLIHLLLADRDGPLDRQDAVALAAGFVGLLFSGVAVAMAVVVGVATLVRRGWRVALFHAAPLGIAYLAWWIGYGSSHSDDPLVDRAEGLATFVRDAVADTFDGLGQLPGLGVVLAVVLVVGSVFVVRGISDRAARARLAAPAAMLAGVIAYLLFTGRGVSEFGRSLGPLEGTRHVHIVAALMLPALVVAADAIGRRWRRAVPVLVVLFLAGIPGNLADFGDHRDELAGSTQELKETILLTPRLQVATLVPRGAVPVPERRGTTPVPVGWMLDGVAAGRFPELSDPSPEAIARTTFALVVRQARFETPGRCRELDEPFRHRFDAGEAVGIEGSAVAVSFDSLGRGVVKRVYRPRSGPTLVVRGGFELTFAAVPDAGPASVCIGAGESPDGG